jgi:hypothetical protein
VHFSESDLLRFFNSVAETETNLKEATQPRYMLELGLVRLVEMRRLTPIDKILERLAALEIAYGTATEMPLSQAATAEKKTLNDEPTKAHDIALEIADFEDDEIEAISLPSYAIPEISLSPLSSADLEHFDDPKLDERYERLFEVNGLVPLIANVSELVRGFSGEISIAAGAGPVTNGSSIRQTPVIPASNGNGHKPADIPALPPDPTEEDLRRYAESHPAIRKVMDMFRAEIVEVTKIER